MFDLSNFPHISIILSDSLQIYLSDLYTYRKSTDFYPQESVNFYMCIFAFVDQSSSWFETPLFLHSCKIYIYIYIEREREKLAAGAASFIISDDGLIKPKRYYVDFLSY